MLHCVPPLTSPSPSPLPLPSTRFASLRLASPRFALHFTAQSLDSERAASASLRAELKRQRATTDALADAAKKRDAAAADKLKQLNTKLELQKVGADGKELELILRSCFSDAFCAPLPLYRSRAAVSTKRWRVLWILCVQNWVTPGRK